jgi:hypothetical protein
VPDPQLDRTDAEKSAVVLIVMNVIAALDRAGLDVPGQGSRCLDAAEDAATMSVDSLREAGLLVTPVQAAYEQLAAAARALDAAWLALDEDEPWESEQFASAATEFRNAVASLPAPTVTRGGPRSAAA